MNTWTKNLSEHAMTPKTSPGDITQTKLNHILSNTVFEHLFTKIQTLTDQILHSSSLTIQNFNLLCLSKFQSNWITQLHHLFQTLDLPQSWIIDVCDPENKACDVTVCQSPRHVKILFISTHIKDIVHQTLVKHLEETMQHNVYVLDSTPTL